MKSNLTLALFVAMAAAAPAPGIRTVAETTDERTLSVATALGDSSVSARQMRVDLDFPSGKSGKGSLLILFEPSTGYFFHFFRWDKSDYPRASLTDSFVAGTWLGASADRLLLFTNDNPWLVIHESSEKAASLNEAEAASLRWANGHLADIEAWAGGYHTASLDLRSLRDLPGFLPSGDDAGPGLPIRILGVVWADTAWELTIEGQWKAKVRVDDRYGFWGVSGYAQVDESREKK
jgi:hypothetical protein